MAHIAKAIMCAVLMATLALTSCASMSSGWVGIDKKLGSGIHSLKIEDEISTSLCTAVLINESLSLLVTAAHCFPTDVSKSRTFKIDGLDMTPIVVDRLADLAVVQAIGIKGKALKVDLHFVQIGEPVAFIGMGITPNLKATFGFVASLGDASMVRGLLFNATAVPGQSGGAIVAQDGTLVSIIQGDWNDNKNRILFSYGPWQGALRDFLAPYLP